MSTFAISAHEPSPTPSPGASVMTITPGENDVCGSSAYMNTNVQSVAVSTQFSCVEDKEGGLKETCTPTLSPPLPTPVKVSTINKLLSGYHDAEYIIKGFTHGFRVNFEGPGQSLKSKNSRSALHHQDIVSQKIEKEIKLDRIAGPFDTAPFGDFKCSPLSVREKQQPGSYRLLHNLSYPYDESAVNFNIPKEASHVAYAPIDEAFQLVRDHSPAAYMAKSDIKDAFRLIPIHPSDYHLMGFTWKGQYFYDKCLPMGCSTSCRIFERFSSAIAWILTEKLGVTHLTKILDDFFFTGPTHVECNRSLQLFKCLCDQLGIPVAAEKTIGPDRVMIFRGIELDSVKMIARLPVDKLKAYFSEVQNISHTHKITLRELKSIIGKLQFACAVVPSGRAFLRRLHDHTIGIQKPHFFIRVTKAIKADLQVWASFLKHFNGKSFMYAKLVSHSNTIHMYTDASHHGYGGTFGTNWIQGEWPNDWLTYSIQVLELYPIFLLVAIFADKIAGSHIVFHTDNQAIVAVLNKQTSKCPHIMAIIRPLVLLLLKHQISFNSIHIPGVQNHVCDALSRQQGRPELMDRYGMKSSPTPVPHHLLPGNFKLS